MCTLVKMPEKIRRVCWIPRNLSFITWVQDNVSPLSLGFTGNYKDRKQKLLPSTSVIPVLRR